MFSMKRKPPASIGAEGDLEQALRQLGVCADEAARGSRGEAFALTQVDGHVAAVRGLLDALDRGVERVYQREPRNRLADDADDGLQARERDGDETDAAAPSARASRAMNGESTSTLPPRRARGGRAARLPGGGSPSGIVAEGARELHAALAYRSTRFPLQPPRRKALRSRAETSIEGAASVRPTRRGSLRP